MSWPTPQDYNEAVQHPASCFRDSVLRRGTVETTALGLPRPNSGAFASVYKVTNDDEVFAVRCFLSEILDQEQRYEHLSNFVMSDDLPYTVDFEYQPQGIKIRGNWYPILKMAWVSGTPLVTYVEANLQRPNVLLALAESFRQMIKDLQMCGVAHGDLQHGNVIILDNGEIRLIDYDGMFVPSLFGISASELGHRNYQHPLRDAMHFGPYLDNFSAWIIYLSLQVLARDHGLWKELGGGDEALILKRTDFIAPAQSPRFEHLLNHENEEIRAIGKQIQQMLAMNLEEVPALDFTGFAVNEGALVLPNAIDRWRWNFTRWWKKTLRERFGNTVQYHPKETPPPPQKVKAEKEPEWWQLKEGKKAEPLDKSLESKIAQLSSGPKSESNRDKVRRLLRLAQLHSSHYQFAEAHKVFDQLAVVSIDSNKRRKIEVLEEQVQTFGLEGDYLFSRSKVVGASVAYERALKTMQKVRQLKDNVAILGDDLIMLRLLWSLADAYERCGRMDQMKDTLQQYIQVCTRHKEISARKIKAQDRLLDAIRAKPAG